MKSASNEENTCENLGSPPTTTTTEAVVAVAKRKELELKMQNTPEESENGS